MSSRIAVIGAGVSGMAAIRCCLEAGLEPVCYDIRGNIGGLWDYDPYSPKCQSTVMKSTVTNIGKEFTCFSDFPFPKEFPYYMHHSKMLEYLRMYADKFQLQKHVTFHTEVTKVSQTSRCNRGQWQVDRKYIKTGQHSSEIFDGVLVCNGKNAFPHMPAFEGMDVFRGIQIHSQEYREPSLFKDKRVVVVGMSNSGCDIVQELAGVSRDVIVSTCTGAWIIPRLIDRDGIPFDLKVLSRWQTMIPKRLKNWITERKLDSLGFRVDPEYRRGPRQKFSSTRPVINDGVKREIDSGRVTVKPNIARLTRDGVQFEDGSVVKDVDAVIYATGYDVKLPFLHQTEYDLTKNPLYKNVFSPEVEPATLGLIGIQEVSGSPIVTAELQSRWAVDVIAGKVKLPSKQEMWNGIRSRHLRASQDGVSPLSVTDWIAYLDEIAEFVGCKPNFFYLFFRDLKLWWAMIFGPCIPAQYRLTGRGSWPEARQTILTTLDRIKKD